MENTWSRAIDLQLYAIVEREQREREEDRAIREYYMRVQRQDEEDQRQRKIHTLESRQIEAMPPGPERDGREAQFREMLDIFERETRARQDMFRRDRHRPVIEKIRKTQRKNLAARLRDLQYLPGIETRGGLGLVEDTESLIGEYLSGKTGSTRQQIDKLRVNIARIRIS